MLNLNLSRALETGANMNWLCRRLCGVQSVQVVYGGGQVLYFSPHTTVEEVLYYYPHHFLCQRELNSYSGWRSNQMLPMNAELQSGCIYFLFPLPRLFPTEFSLQSCRCYQHQNSTILAKETPHRTLRHIQSPTCNSSLIFYDPASKIGGLQSPSWSLKSKPRRSSFTSKVSPVSNLYSGGRCDINLLSTSPLQLRDTSCPWRPRLGCINEEDDLKVSFEDVKHCVKIWKRDTQAASKSFLPQRVPVIS